ncbi:MAG: type I secretion C-terminal target domain-containing protein [Alphaproteobacteria bacterium]|nr:type I secretion C-terminal target domain-containing protein [Alphaproteobacteria bacterium]
MGLDITNDTDEGTEIPNSTIRSSLNNLVSKSARARDILDRASKAVDPQGDATSLDVEVVVDDGTEEFMKNGGPAVWTREMWNTEYPTEDWPFGEDSDFVVYIPTTSFDGDGFYYGTEFIKTTFERMLSHELIHLEQFLDGQPYNESAARQGENEIMELLGDPAGLRAVPDGPGSDPLDGSGLEPQFRYPEDTFPTDPHITPDDLADWLPDPLNLFGIAPQQDSPLVLDLDGDGIELTAIDTENPEVAFDLDNDGFAEVTGWVSADDGLLARDINENGRIDDASELFGSASTDGFAILSLLDSNGDLVINQNDTAFSELLIWQDANGDGVSQTEELHDLTHYDIVSIDVAGVTASTAVIAGNQISHTSTFTYENGSHGAIVDAWFSVDNTLSSYAQSYMLDVRAMFLPALRGYGELADLHIAMSIDNGTGGLLELVEEFADGFSFAAFADEGALREDIEEILFLWANVTEEGQNFTNGPYAGQAAYAEEVQFLEKLFGVMSESTRYNPDGTGGRVPGGSGRALAESFEIAYQNLSAQLLIQVGAGLLFDEVPTYDAVSGEIEGDLTLSETGIDSLVAFATASGVDAEAYWLAVAKFLDTVKGFENFSSTENGWMDAAIYDSDPGRTWSGIKDLAAFEYQPSTIYGTSDDDVIDGTAGDNIIYGYTGNDVIDGKAGNDTLIGNTSGPVTSEDGATYIGGAGDDFVNGGQGNDIYIYTSGDDFYEDISGTDVLRLPNGIVLGDLHFAVSDTYNLIITVGDLGSIEIKGQFQNNPYFIETIEFYDTSTLSLSTLNNITQYGTGGNDTITGIAYGGGDDDIIYGMDGNDTINGGTGDDVIDGGAGNDTITPGDGNDTIIASEGFDTILASDASETLVIPEAFSASDVILLREADGSGNDKELKIIVNGLGQIHVDDHFQGTNKALDQISFANGVDASINLLTYSFITIGTNGDDTFDTSGYGLSNTSDIYLFGKGTDTVLEYAGTDTVLFGAGVSLSNLTIIKTDTGSSASTRNFLVISDADGNSLTVERHFDGSGYKIENLKLNNGTVISVASLEIDSHGSEGNDRIDGLESGDLSTDDVMYGHGGADQIYGGTGNDISYGGDGNDYIFDDTGNDVLYGEDGDDQLYGYWGDDQLFGGVGNDTLRGDDTFGSSSVTGNDYLSGGDGNDHLYGGRGDDTLDGGAGDDTINGDGDTDTVTYASATSGVTVSLATTSAQNTGGAGTDTISNVENLTGSSYADTLTGNSSANVISGGDGNDTLYGGAGNDTLKGGAGADTLYGDANGDTFVFEAASAFSAVDTIADFSPAQSDKINIADLLDGYVPGTSDINDFVIFTTVGSNTELSVDRDGTGTTHSAVTVASITGVTGLDADTLLGSGLLIAA